MPNVGRYKSQSPSADDDAARRIGNKVKDIKSFATIRQSPFHDPSCFTSRSCGYSCVADVVCHRSNRNLMNGGKLLSKGYNIILKPEYLMLYTDIS